MNEQSTARATESNRLGVVFTLVVVLAGTSPGSLLGASIEPIVQRNAAGRVMFVSAERGDVLRDRSPIGGPLSSPVEFLREYGAQFGIKDVSQQLVAVGAARDSIGHIRTTYQQVYQGVLVYSGVLRVHQRADGAVVAVNGDFYAIGGKVQTRASINLSQAVELANEEVGTTGATIELNRLVIVDPGWYGDPPRGARLAYHVVLSARPGPLREALFIDAITGATLDRWSLIYDARERMVHDATAGTDCCFDHAGPGCDQPDCEAAVCAARPVCCEAPWSRTCAAWSAYVCEDSCLPGTLGRAEGDEATNIADVDAAYDYLGDTYDYFYRAFGRDGIDDAGGAMVATVHSLATSCPNAFWTGDRLLMAFCEGVVSDDVVAHEMTHGITQFTADLIYQNQPGQLNESFSDVFGELVDLFNGDAAFVDVTGEPGWPGHGTGPGSDTPNTRRTGCSDARTGYPDGLRWLAAEDATAFGGAIRDLWDPTCAGDPDRANSRLQTCDFLDAGGVHSGSGIPNHAFALLVDGGTFNGYEIEGIGPIKAGAVWYRALATYLTIASDFEEAYAALNQAALDLVGTSPNDPRTGSPSGDPFTLADAAAVDQALRAVEMNTGGRCGATVDVLDSAPRGLCGDARMIFADDFEGNDPGWWVYHESPAELPTPYDWARTTVPLPLNRDGTAWFCEDLDDGDCLDQNETAVHYLVSPQITLPFDAHFPFAAFTHYVATEGAWDGGTLSVRVNDEGWRRVPRSSFEFNPYNSVLHGAGTRSANPIGDREAWTGVGGRWGTSIIDLSAMARGGDTIELRFAFGKDGCGGLDGWYVDDFRVYDCPDCNLNHRPDQQDLSFTLISDARRRIGVGAPQRFVIERPLPAAGDVRLTFDGIGDFSTEGEAVKVFLNGSLIGEIFVMGAEDCPSTPNRDELSIPAAAYNATIAGADAVFDLVASEYVNPELCFGRSLLMASIQYDLEVNDVDADGVPDECQNCSIAISPAPDTSSLVQIRYLSVFPQNSGRQTALRVCAATLPAPLLDKVGTCQWASRPTAVSLHPGQTDTTPPTEVFARLSCRPFYADWGALGRVHLFGELVVPDGAYEVQAVDLACGVQASAFYSPVLRLQGDGWADIAGSCGERPCEGPDGVVDIIDITAMVEAFEGNTAAIGKSVADLGPTLPDQTVDVLDIVLVIDAFEGGSYPFFGFSLPCGP